MQVFILLILYFSSAWIFFSHIFYSCIFMCRLQKKPWTHNSKRCYGGEAEVQELRFYDVQDKHEKLRTIMSWIVHAEDKVICEVRPCDMLGNPVRINIFSVNKR